MPRRNSRIQPYQTDRNEIVQRTRGTQRNREVTNLFRQNLVSQFMDIYRTRQGEEEAGGRRIRNAGRQNDENLRPGTVRGDTVDNNDNATIIPYNTDRPPWRARRYPAYPQPQPPGYVPIGYGGRVPRYTEMYNRSRTPRDATNNNQMDQANNEIGYDSEGEPCPNFSEELAFQINTNSAHQIPTLPNTSNRQAADTISMDRLRDRQQRLQEDSGFPETHVIGRVVIEQLDDGRPQAIEMSRIPDESPEETVGDMLANRERTRQNASDFEAHEIITYERVPNCSYLSMGMVFKGQQIVTERLQFDPQEKDILNQWEVTVKIQACNMETGYVCGTMQANLQTGSSGPVLTCWVGEIIDNENYQFITDKWCAEHTDDHLYWSRFPSYLQIKDTVRQGRSNELSKHSHIYMRWKEQFFVQETQNNQLSIQGFYYVALDRRTGGLQGWYFSRCLESGCQELKLDIVQGQELRTAGKNLNRKKLEGEDEGGEGENKRVKRCKGMQGQGFPAYGIY